MTTSIDDLYDALQLFKNYVQANFPYKLTNFKGSIDPSDVGFTANVPSIYVKVDISDNVEQVFLKTGTLDTDWTVFGGGNLSGWLIGAGAPDNGDGEEGMFYLQIDTAIFNKQSGVWVSVFNPGVSGPFTALSDVPSTYTGDAGKVVTVNGTEDGLIFTTPATPPSAFTDLTDTPAVYTGDANKLVAVNGTEDGLVFITPPTAVGTFTDLTDVPSTYTGDAGKVVTVNGTEDGLIFSTPVTSFSALTDTPATYTSQAGKVVTVNGTEDGVEFTSLPATPAFTDLPDTPATYTSQAGKYVTVNGTEDGVEFVPPHKNVIVTWDVTPVTTSSTVTYLSVDGATFNNTTKVMQSDFPTSTGPGDYALGVVKTDLTLEELGTGNNLCIGTLPGEAITAPLQIYIIGFAPSALTATQIRSRIWDSFFTPNSVASPLISGYYGESGTGVVAGVRFRRTNDIDTDWVTVQCDDTIVTGAAGGKHTIAIDRIAGGNIGLTTYFENADTSFDFTASAVTDNPVLPAEMNLFLALFTVDAGSGFMAMSLTLDTANIPADFTVAGTRFASDHPGDAYVDVIPDTITDFTMPFNAVTQVTFPIGADTETIYRSYIDPGYVGPTPQPYGIPVADSDKILVIDNVGSGTESFHLVEELGTFLTLTDTPASYVGQANKLVSVNGTSTGLTFIQSDLSTGISDFDVATNALAIPATAIQEFTRGASGTGYVDVGYPVAVKAAGNVLTVTPNSAAYIVGGFKPDSINTTTAWSSFDASTLGTNMTAGFVFANADAYPDDVLKSIVKGYFIDTGGPIHGTCQSLIHVQGYNNGITASLKIRSQIAGGSVAETTLSSLTAGSVFYLGLEYDGGTGTTLKATRDTTAVDHTVVLGTDFNLNNMRMYFFCFGISALPSCSVKFYDDSLTSLNTRGVETLATKITSPFIGKELVASSDGILAENTYTTGGTLLRQISKGNLVKVTSIPEKFFISKHAELQKYEDVIYIPVPSGAWSDGWVEAGSEKTYILYEPATGNVTVKLHADGTSATGSIVLDLTKIGLATPTIILGVAGNMTAYALSSTGTLITISNSLSHSITADLRAYFTYNICKRA